MGKGAVSGIGGAVGRGGPGGGVGAGRGKGSAMGIGDGFGGRASGGDPAVGGGGNRGYAGVRAAPTMGIPAPVSRPAPVGVPAPPARTSHPANTNNAGFVGGVPSGTNPAMGGIPGGLAGLVGRATGNADIPGQPSGFGVGSLGGAVTGVGGGLRGGFSGPNADMPGQPSGFGPGSLGGAVTGGNPGRVGSPSGGFGAANAGFGIGGGGSSGRSSSDTAAGNNQGQIGGIPSATNPGVAQTFGRALADWLGKNPGMMLSRTGPIGSYIGGPIPGTATQANKSDRSFGSPRHSEPAPTPAGFSSAPGRTSAPRGLAGFDSTIDSIADGLRAASGWARGENSRARFGESRRGAGRGVGRAAGGDEMATLSRLLLAPRQDSRGG